LGKKKKLTSGPSIRTNMDVLYSTLEYYRDSEQGNEALRQRASDRLRERNAGLSPKGYRYPDLNKEVLHTFLPWNRKARMDHHVIESVARRKEVKNKHEEILAMKKAEMMKKKEEQDAKTAKSHDLREERLRVRERAKLAKRAKIALPCFEVMSRMACFKVCLPDYFLCILLLNLTLEPCQLVGCFER